MDNYNTICNGVKPIKKSRNLEFFASKKTAKKGFLNRFLFGLFALSFLMISQAKAQAAPIPNPSMCTAGNYYNTTTEKCVACPDGTFQPGEGQTTCNDCPAGTTTSGVGSINCDVITIIKTPETGRASSKQFMQMGKVYEISETCKDGFVLRHADTPMAICECPMGHEFNGVGAAATCAQCPVGSYNIKENSTCIQCPAGTASNIAGLMAICPMCPPGTYQPQAGQAECLPVGSGYYTTITGNTTCENEIFGGKGPDLGQKTTETVLIDSTWWTISATCNSNFILTNQGTTTAVCQCPIGFELIGTGPGAVCSSCPEGYIGVEINGTCGYCGKGSYCSGNIRTACPMSSTTSTNASTSVADCNISECPAGTKTIGLGSEVVTCQPCPEGEFQNVMGKIVCKSCQAEKPGYTNTGTGNLTCEVKTSCENGPTIGQMTTQDVYDETNQCWKTVSMTCRAGFFMKEGTEGTISAVCECRAGSGYESQQDSCAICRPGTWNGTVNAVCAPCSAGTSNPDSGRITECTPCEAGKFQETEGMVSCNPCMAGEYQTQTGQISCTKCALGTASSQVERQTACDPCLAGSFANTEGLPICNPCSAGTASDVGARQTECDSCAIGEYTNIPGMTTCLTCEAGWTNDIEGSTTCPVKIAGEAGNDLGQATTTDILYNGKWYTVSITCNQGFILRKPNTHQAVCQCPEGFELSGTGRSAYCNPCGGGQYNDAVNSTCKLCAKGSATSDNSRPTACPVCPPSSYQDQEGQTTCKPITQGYYTTGKENVSQYPCGIGYYCNGNIRSRCPLNTTTVLATSFTVGECNVSTCGVGTRTVGLGSLTVTCESCPAGFFQDEAGKIDCKPCATFFPGFSNTPIGSSQQTVCGKGFFCNDGIRTPCPEGSTTEGNNSTEATSCTVSLCGVGEMLMGGGTMSARCQPCPQNQYQDEAGQTICKMCAEGTENTGDGNISCPIVIKPAIVCSAYCQANPMLPVCMDDCTYTSSCSAFCIADPALPACMADCSYTGI